MRLYLHIVAYMVAWSIGITMALHVPSGEVRAANTLDESVYSGKEEGWFFYKDPVDQEQKQEEQKEPPASLPVQETESPKKFERQSVLVSQPEKPKPLSVRWIRENLPKLLDTAIDDPTPENVAAYLYAHRIMMDKAQNFAKVSYRVSRLDPLLNEETRFPFSNAMRAGFFRLQNEAKKAALKEDIARKAGIWFFFSSDCPYCRMQYDPVKHLAEDYGMIVYNVSLDGKPLPGMEHYVVDQGQSRALELKVVPAVALAIPPDTVVVISQGLLSESAMDNRILLVAEQHNLISEKYRRLINVNDRGVLPPDVLRNVPEEDMDDPARMVKYIRNELIKQYW